MRISVSDFDLKKWGVFGLVVGQKTAGCIKCLMRGSNESK